MTISKAYHLLAMFIAVLITSCGSTPQEQKTSTAISPSTGIENPSEITIGLSMKTLNAPYFNAQLKSVEKQVKARGMNFIYIDAQDDILKQIANVEDLLARGIDLLIMNPLDPKALILATKAATRAGVPVVLIDSNIDPSADFVTTIQSNNMRNGELVGEWLVKQMDGKYIKAALLSGAQGNPAGKERRQGLIRGITEQQLRSEGRAGFELVAQGWGNWTYQGGLTAMEDILVAHSDINVLISEQDAMAMGAMQAIKEAGKQDEIFIVAAADGQKEAFELIMKGEYGATGLNDPALIAEMAVDIAVRILSGESDFPQLIYTPAAVISSENVEKFYNPEAIF